MAELFKGADVTAALNQKMQEKIVELKAKGVEPTLAIVRVGENGPDVSYEKGAMKRCDAVGVKVKNCVFPEDVSHETIMNTIEELNNDDKIHGVLIFRPFPSQIDGEAVRMALAPEKDIDGITDGSLAGVFTGTKTGFAPCTAQAAVEIIDHYGIDVKGMDVVVVGRSLVVGKPAFALLLNRSATVQVCHSKTRDIEEKCKNADLIIACVGHAGFIKKENCKPGQIIIDVGINFGEDGKMCGDVKFDEVEPIVKAITPVPGGVGTVTSSVLVSHVVEAAERSIK